ncbi:MAG: CPBP family intramembrane glutamic endopeptidase [Cyclobacteriaceae bacterium]
MKLIQKVKYYFLPGLVPTALLVLFHTIFSERWPSMTILIIIDMLVTIPLMLGLLSRGTGIYFRGFLLPREKYKDWRAPLVNTVLFCAYHIWSPWLILTRVIATFPMYYFVWKYRNISLSIIPHILLNLVGDVILMYPLIFNQ